MNTILYIIIGIIAGFIAGIIMKLNGTRLFIYILVAIVGSLLGAWLFGFLDFVAENEQIGRGIVAFFGSALLMWFLYLAKK